MGSTILFDGHHLTMPGATGIGTYTRTLTTAARNLGLGTQVLLGGNATVSKRDPQLSEVSFFDARISSRMPLALRLQGNFAKAMGVPFGVRPSIFSRVGAVLDVDGSNIGKFDRTYVAPIIFDLARYHFNRFGVRANVVPPEPPSLFHMSFPLPLATPKCPNIYTIHDIVPLRLPQTTLDDKRFFLRLIRHLCAKADHIITVSEFSRQDIIKFTGISPDRITNTYQCVQFPESATAKTDEEAAEEIGSAFNLEFGKYYLFNGAIEPKKNVSRLIDGYASSGSRYPLVLVGGLGWQYDRELEKIGDERFFSYRRGGGEIIPNRRVRRLPYLPLPQLVSLIRGARGLLFPSLYEGFGLPVLEAMSLGVPTITSNVASLPEISADAALLVDPTDTDAIAKAIRAFDRDDGLRDDLAARGRVRAKFFSPSKYAARLANVYRKLGVDLAQQAAELE